MAAYLRGRNTARCIECLDEASSIIGRALIIIEPLRSRRIELGGAYRLFSELSDEIAIAFEDPEKLKEVALELFNATRDQHGLVLAVRASMFGSKGTDQGRHMKRCQDLVNQAISHVEQANVAVTPSLFLCRAQLFIEWRVLGKKSDIPWACIRDDLKVAVASPIAARDPLWIFFLGVAHYHLGERPMAEALFSELRRMQLPSILRQPARCMYLDEHGKPRTFQGTLSTGAGNDRYIRCAELGTDLMARRGEFRQPDGASVHFHAAFTVLGPLAVSNTVSDLNGVEL